MHCLYQDEITSPSIKKHIRVITRATHQKTPILMCSFRKAILMTFALKTIKHDSSYRRQISPVRHRSETHTRTQKPKPKPPKTENRNACTQNVFANANPQKDL